MASVYYGLRYGTLGLKHYKRRGGRVVMPPFVEALERATPIELEKAIAYMERTQTISLWTVRVERMKQRLQELDAPPPAEPGHAP